MKVVSDYEQRKNAEEELAAAKARRSAERERKVHSYGILNRKMELSKEVQRRAREMCNCGFFDFDNNTGRHKEDCPVVRAARKL